MAAVRLWVVLSRAYSSIEAHVKDSLARHGLTPAEFFVLETLDRNGSKLLGEIRQELMVSSGGITYLIDRLENKGLVERRACKEDRRATYAALTGEGDALLRSIVPEHARVLEQALSGLTLEEQAQITALLCRLGHRAERLPQSYDDGLLAARASQQ